MSVPHDRVHQSSNHTSDSPLSALDWIATLLMIIGAINWGLVGAFDLNLVATLFGEGTTVSRAVYILVGLAGLYGLVMLAKLARYNHR